MMRITNSIIANNSKFNVNTNKTSVDKLNQQMSDQKRIHAPSEDPVIAIRSLRLRGALNQIDQYYTKNIPDAMSWLDITETALTNMKGLISNVSKQCNYGSTDTLEKADRQVILDELSETRKQIYTEGNADYAGRTLFTGWKTQEYLTFQVDDLKSSYYITEKFSAEDIQDLTYINDEPAIAYGTLEEILEEKGVTPTYDVSADHQIMPTVTETTRLVLGYTDLAVPTEDPAGSGDYYYTDPTEENNPVPKEVVVSYVDKDGHEKTIKCAIKTIDTTEHRDEAYNVDGKGKPDSPIEAINYIPETGELILNNAAKLALRNATDIQFSYVKTGFQAGELRPEHYYDCTRTVDEAGDATHVTYTKEPNDIDYTISFNQTIKINTEASDVFDSRMARYIDDMITNLQALNEADTKIANIEKMMEESRYSSEEDQEKLKTMLNAATKERDLLDDKTQKLFDKNIGIWQDYLDKINLAITDCGSRYARVELTESRMQSQQSTFQKLKSTNEDKELSEIIIDYTSASTAYQSSLKATSKALQQTLLDYL